MDNLTNNPTMTAQRKQTLDKYFKENVLKGKEFVCPHFKECRHSHPDIFYEGQLHHVGNHYDISFSGHPFRVMVIGQEYGHGPSCVSMDERSTMVLEQSGLQKTFSNRNPHMRGTTNVLRLLFELPLGRDHSDEFIQSTDHQIFHLFDAFSLVNYLLCTAIGTGETRSGKSTPTMRRNCLIHFSKILRILEPNVVIVQGKSYWTSIRKGFNNLKQISDTLYDAEINQQ